MKSDREINELVAQHVAGFTPHKVPSDEQAGDISGQIGLPDYLGDANEYLLARHGSGFKNDVVVKVKVKDFHRSGMFGAYKMETWKKMRIAEVEPKSFQV
jgi:hypothetical protein